MTERFSLKGRIVVVTEASQGIGWYTTIAMAESDALVVAVGRVREPLDRLQREIAMRGGRVIPMTADVSRPDQLEVLAQSVRNAHGRVDILVTNVGLPPTSKRAELVTDVEFDRSFTTVVRGTFFACQFFGRIMLDQGFGRIINIAPAIGLDESYVSVATATQAAIVSMTKSFAVEWGPRNVKVNAIAPGRLAPDEAEQPDQNGVYQPGPVRHSSARRLPGARDVAPTAVYLASAAAASLQGAVIVVDEYGTGG